jgi:hypothetical protein
MARIFLGLFEYKELIAISHKLQGLFAKLQNQTKFYELFSTEKICEPGAWSRGPVVPQSMVDQPPLVSIELARDGAHDWFQAWTLTTKLLGGRRSRGILTTVSVCGGAAWFGWKLMMNNDNALSLTWRWFRVRRELVSEPNGRGGGRARGRGPFYRPGQREGEL